MWVFTGKSHERWSARNFNNVYKDSRKWYNTFIKIAKEILLEDNRRFIPKNDNNDGLFNFIAFSFPKDTILKIEEEIKGDKVSEATLSWRKMDCW